MKKLLIFYFLLCSLFAQTQTLADSTKIIVFDRAKSWVTTGALLKAYIAGTIAHNTLSSIDGGTSGQYYHLTSAEYTGSGSGVFARITSPVFTTPSLGTPSAGNLTNCINLPLTTGITGTLGVGNGGTGATTLTGILQGNATGAFTAITSTTAGQIPRCTGSNTFAFGALDLADADAVTGVLPYANGGNSITTGRSTAQTAAASSVATLTVGGADASYEISGNILITTSSGEAFSLQVDYTDEGNTARTATIPLIRISTGGFTATTISASGAVPYPSGSIHLRCKASTAITIKTSGTFTGCTYNVDGRIQRL